MDKSKSFPGSAHRSTSYYDIGSDYEDRFKPYSFNSPSGATAQDITTCGNPELKRRKRVASYNMYSVEAKLKSSFRNSFKWIKNKLVDDNYDN
ncbi:hypothetical protein L6164_012305 [Bauhinia variegata]|uniref:Uncharacterized protein n=1 Tax=Bauhinia variegata TaxID=167791 RepID=A0ACB9PCI5_BAUVA|nr:hypothetical protein L6164_012305 [Bauhinia variegata]